MIILLGNLGVMAGTIPKVIFRYMQIGKTLSSFLRK
jgi:hypothetical protein